MTLELFELSPVAVHRPLSAYREELSRALNEALRTCDEMDMVGEGSAIFRDLATDSDTEGARRRLEFLTDWLNGPMVRDHLFDHINGIGWAFWRLNRAELRILKNL